MLFSFKRGEKCLFGLTKKTKGNLINTVNSSPKLFVSKISFVCGIVIRRLEEKKILGLFIFKNGKKQQQGKMFNLII